MKLECVSITGADDNVDIAALNGLAAAYPFAECALLLLPEQAGESRCPSKAWISRFAALYKGAHKAIHLCSGALIGFAEDDPEIMGIIEDFQRVQLNLNFGDVDSKYNPAALLKQIGAHPAQQFIIQYTPERAGLLPQLKDIPNHALLFDASAGRGLAPQNWPAPLPGHHCGYAGGLSPENIGHHLPLIARAAGNATTWIDMESGIRTDDRFDFAKVRRIMDAARPYL